MAEQDSYIPPKVWKWNKESGGRFANINRPIAGPTHEQDLPAGEHDLQLHSLATPEWGKGHGIVLWGPEELLELGIEAAEYDAYTINIGEGQQFSSGFVEINPNSKIPALLDRGTTPPTRVFESGAILVYHWLKSLVISCQPSPAPAVQRVYVLVILADGQRAIPRRRIRPLLRG